MPHILAAPCFVLLLAACGMAIDSSRSLLSTRDVENIRAAKAYAAGCKLSHGEHTLPVYHIYADGSGWRLSERNAGDTLGDLSFVFPRGFQAYYEDGEVSMVQASYNHWHKYLKCNHPHGSHTYSCKGGTYNLAGRESAGKGYWYSFPKLGKDKHWWESSSSSGECGYIRIKAKCLFNLMAVAGGKCPKGCDSLSFQQCSQCMGQLSLEQEKQVWDHAIWNNKCHRIGSDRRRRRRSTEGRRRRRRSTEVDDELNDDLDPDGAFRNTSRSEAPRAPPQPPADSSTDTTTASRDKDVVVV